MNASANNLPQKFRTISSGFTLIELMVTIAVLAVIVTIAGPNISNELANQRLKSTTATLNNALREAKVESVIRRQVLTVDYNNNGTSSGTISITDPNSNVIASYQYNPKSTISDNETLSDAIDFSPNKTADEMTYTICDSNTATSPRQIEVSALASITNQFGGVC